MFSDIEALSMNLPEDVMKKKWAGDFEGALALIETYLAKDLPEMLRKRLAMEKEILRRLPGEYPVERTAAIRMVQEKIPDFTEEEFDALEMSGALDYIYVNGKRRYFKRFLRTLLKVNPDIARRAGAPFSSVSPILDGVVKEMKEDGGVSYRLRIRHTLKVEDDAFIPGETYRVHLPIPAPAAQIMNIRLIECSPEPALIADDNAGQRSVFFEKQLDENAVFSVEYEYDNHIVYVDTASEDKPEGKVYPGASQPDASDLGEQLPHIAFTPYLKSLAAEIQGDRCDPLAIARAFYDFITTRVQYTLMREYFTVESIAEYAAINLKGDCGVQALLFITLCRIAGIPARWQSGLYAAPADVGCHDWAQFYVEPYGWLFCDPSFGGSAWRKGNEERWNFYFGNLDPYRMVANSVYQQEFVPPKVYTRIDPYDNQCGECECGLKGFLSEELDTESEMTSIHRNDH